jgi:hypothetical protein
MISSKVRALTRLGEHAVADEAVAHAGDDANLSDGLGRQRHDGCQYMVRAGLVAAHDFQELHHIGGREKVHAQHVLRAAWWQRRFRSRPDRRCWRRGSRPALHNRLSSLPNTSFFTSMLS